MTKEIFMWTISKLKENARNSLNGYYREGIIVCLATSVVTVLVFGGFLLFLFSPPSSSTLQLYTFLPSQPDPNDIKQMYEEVIDSIIVFLCTLLFFLMLTVLTLVFYTNPMEVGKCSFYLKARKGDVRIGELFHAFNTTRYGAIVKNMFFSLMGINGCILFFCFGVFFTCIIDICGGIFGVFKSLEGMHVSSIIADNSNLPDNETMTHMLISLGVLFTGFIGICAVIWGVSKSLECMLVPFLIAENSRLSAKRVTEISTRTMKDEKWKFIQLQLSFLGWILLGVVTLGIGFLFSYPYYQATKAEFYACMREKMIAQGITTEEELTGAVIPQIQQQPYRYDMYQTGGQ